MSSVPRAHIQSFSSNCFLVTHDTWTSVILSGKRDCTPGLCLPGQPWRKKGQEGVQQVPLAQCVLSPGNLAYSLVIYVRVCESCLHVCVRYHCEWGLCVWVYIEWHVHETFVCMIVWSVYGGASFFCVFVRCWCVRGECEVCICVCGMCGACVCVLCMHVCELSMWFEYYVWCVGGRGCRQERQKRRLDKRA